MEKAVNINIEINLSSLVFSLCQLDNEDLVRVFKEVDLQVAEVDFTENLLVILVNSLKGDLSVEEKSTLLDKLSKEIK